MLEELPKVLIVAVAALGTVGCKHKETARSESPTIFGVQPGPPWAPHCKSYAAIGTLTQQQVDDHEKCVKEIEAAYARTADRWAVIKSGHASTLNAQVVAGGHYFFAIQAECIKVAAIVDGKCVRVPPEPAKGTPEREAWIHVWCEQWQGPWPSSYDWRDPSSRCSEEMDAREARQRAEPTPTCQAGEDKVDCAERLARAERKKKHQFPYDESPFFVGPVSDEQ